MLDIRLQRAYGDQVEGPRAISAQAHRTNGSSRHRRRKRADMVACSWCGMARRNAPLASPDARLPLPLLPPSPRGSSLRLFSC